MQGCAPDDRNVISKPRFWDLRMRDDVQFTLSGNSGLLPIERRQAPRSRAGIIGSIRLFGQPPEKCLIADMSTGGARICRFFAGKLPRFLNIEIGAGITVPASVVWEDDNCIGVKFIHTVRLARLTADRVVA